MVLWTSNLHFKKLKLLQVILQSLPAWALALELVALLAIDQRVAVEPYLLALLGF